MYDLRDTDLAGFKHGSVGTGSVSPRFLHQVAVGWMVHSSRLRHCSQGLGIAGGAGAGGT